MVQSFNTFWHNDLFYFFFAVLISKDRTTVSVCVSVFGMGNSMTAADDVTWPKMSKSTWYNSYYESSWCCTKRQRFHQRGQIRYCLMDQAKKNSLLEWRKMVQKVFFSWAYLWLWISSEWRCVVMKWPCLIWQVLTFCSKYIVPCGV